MARWGSSRLGPAVGVGVVVALGVALLALALRQPELPTFPPTPPAPAPAGAGLVGPVVYTVDATAPDRWQYFSFALGSVVEAPGPRGWDLAFRRFHIIANGGPGFEGEGGVLDLGPVVFDAVDAVPEAGYAATTGGPDPANPAIARWYRYGFFSHVLTPKPRVWAVRTADGRYAKLEILGYYCPRARPGCLTFRYVYQGDGSRAVGRHDRSAGQSAPARAIFAQVSRSPTVRLSTGRSGVASRESTQK